MWDYATWKAAAIRSPFDQAPLVDLARLKTNAAIMRVAISLGIIQPEYTPAQEQALRQRAKLARA